MKHISEIEINVNSEGQYTKAEISTVRSFVASVFTLFPNYSNDLLKDDNFRAQCRMYAKEIIAMSPSEFEERLLKSKKLIGVSNMRGLLGNYKNAVQALAITAGDLEKINHDYRIAFPSHQKSTGAVEAIKLIDSSASDETTAQANIGAIKDMLK